METSVTTSKKDEVIDITDKIQKEVLELNTSEGIIVLNVLHTTAALSTADLDPGTDQDILDAARNIVPKLNYRHPHDPQHVPDHILSTLVGTSLTLPVKGKKIILGTWQRIILLEFDGPRDRKIYLSVVPTAI